MKLYEGVDLERLKESLRAKVVDGNVNEEPYASFKPMRRRLQIHADGYT